jgi:Fe-S cluster biogenesis protein NfuA
MNSRDQVETVLNTLRGAMQVDGGDVELVSLNDDIVSVRLRGTCVHCPSAQLTLKHGIELTLKRELPWISEVIQVC